MRLQLNYKGGDLTSKYDKQALIVTGWKELKITIGFLGGVKIPYEHVRSIGYEDMDSMGNRKDKSVLLRALGGTAVLGGVGLALGALSGIGSKKVDKKTDYLVIRYWEPKTELEQVVMFGGKRKKPEIVNLSSKVQKRINKHRKKISKNTNQQNNEKERDKSIKTQLIITLIITFIALLVMSSQ